MGAPISEKEPACLTEQTHASTLVAEHPRQLGLLHEDEGPPPRGPRLVDERQGLGKDALDRVHRLPTLRLPEDTREDELGGELPEPRAESAAEPDRLLPCLPGLRMVPETEAGPGHDLHQEELMADWERLQAGRPPQPIEPLK